MSDSKVSQLESELGALKAELEQVQIANTESQQHLEQLKVKRRCKLAFDIKYSYIVIIFVPSL